MIAWPCERQDIKHIFGQRRFRISWLFYCLFYVGLWHNIFIIQMHGVRMIDMMKKEIARHYIVTWLFFHYQYLFFLFTLPIDIRLIIVIQNFIFIIHTNAIKANLKLLIKYKRCELFFIYYVLLNVSQIVNAKNSAGK